MKCCICQKLMKLKLMKIWRCSNNEDKHYSFYINDNYWQIILSQQNTVFCLISDYDDCSIRIAANKIKIPKIKFLESYQYLIKYIKLVSFS